MDLKEGDLIITLPKVKKIQAIFNLGGGEIGVIVDTGGCFDNLKVYGILINDQVYYLFEDEIQKLEK
jgi:hypothetical protein